MVKITFAEDWEAIRDFYKNNPHPKVASRNDADFQAAVEQKNCLIVLNDDGDMIGCCFLIG